MFGGAGIVGGAKMLPAMQRLHQLQMQQQHQVMQQQLLLAQQQAVQHQQSVHYQQQVLLQQQQQARQAAAQTAPAAGAGQKVMEWDPATGKMVESSMDAEEMKALATAVPGKDEATACACGAPLAASACGGSLEFCTRCGAKAGLAGLFPHLAVLAAEPAQPEEPAVKKARTQGDEESAEDGYFRATLGYSVTGGASRYIIVDKKPLGVGVFSAVYPVADAENKLIALKVIRRQDFYRKFAERETEMLKRLQEMAELDKAGSDSICMLRDHFVHVTPKGEDYLCLAFAHLYRDLRSAGRLPVDKVLVFTKQLLCSLRYLHDHVGLVHCDVKPDNLMMRHDEKAVKLCDFGAARSTSSNELQATDELQPMFYRAPEVFLGCPRGRKIDIWSVGCTVYEMAVGRVLFKSCITPKEVMEKIMMLRGAVPVEMREKGRLATNFFVVTAGDNRGFQREGGGMPVDPESYRKQLMWNEIAPYADFGKAANARSAQDLAKDQLSRLIGRTCVIAAVGRKKKAGPNDNDRKLKLLGDLVDLCMDINPATRPTAAALVTHEILKDVALPDPFELQEAPPLPSEDGPTLPQEPVALAPAPAPASGGGPTPPQELAAAPPAAAAA